MQTFRLLSSSQVPVSLDENSGSQDLLGAKGIRSLYTVTQQPEFGNTNYMKGVKSLNELWRVPGGDLSSLIDLPLRPRAALQLGRADLTRAFPLQPGRASLQTAERGEPIPALHAADNQPAAGGSKSGTQPSIAAGDTPAEQGGSRAPAKTAGSSRKQTKRRRVQAGV